MTLRIDIATIIESQVKSSFRTILIGLVSITAFLEGFDAQIQGYTAPTLIKLWHISRSSFSPVFVFFQIGVFFGAIFMGSMGDVIGRRLMIIMGSLGFGVFTLVGGYTDNVFELSTTRFLSAVFLGGAIPNAIALIIDYSPLKRRALSVGIMYALYGIGSTAGGFLAAWLVPRFGWQSIYYLCGSLSVALCVILYFFLPESARFMVLRQRNLTTLAATLHNLAPHLNIPSDAIFFVRDDVEKRAGVIELFTDGRALATTALWSAFILNMIVLIFVTSWMPVLYTDSGVSYSGSVIATSLFQGGGAVGCLLGCWILDQKMGVLLLAALCMIAVPIILVTGHANSTVSLLILLTCIAGVCIVGTNAGLNALGGLLYPTTLRATGSGWASAIARVGAIIGPLLGGVLLNFHFSLPVIFLVIAIPPFFVSLLLICLNFARLRIRYRHILSEDTYPLNVKQPSEV